MKVPFFFARFGRSYVSDGEWSLIVIFAPFPIEEQLAGHLIKALVNLQVRLRPRWPIVTIDFYSADRSAEK